MLTPRTPGTEWIAALHGVRLATSIEDDRAGRDTWFATWCERRAIPTGTVIPAEAATLAIEAYQLRSRWVGDDLEAMAAEALETERRRTAMVAEVLEMCGPALAMAAE